MNIFLVLILCLVAVLPNVLSLSLFNHNNRVYGGQFTGRHEYPFAALSLIIDKEEEDFLCGGVLITNKHILMAAKCVYNAVFVRTSLGVHDYDAERTDIIYRIDDLQMYMTVHEDFNPTTLRNNIAILRLKEELEFSEKIQSVALPPASFTPELLRDSTGVIIGWGEFEGSVEKISEPRHANVTIIPSMICAHYYPKQDTSSTVFCSDGEFKTGACKWDEGGPLITTLDDGSQVLIGLISLFGSVGCDVGWPTAYVNVASYIDWIQAKTIAPES